MRGRWRLFRHDAGRVSGPPPWAYVALFCACLLVGHWSAATFNAVLIWPANGVLLAALLQLHRRPAIGVLATCLAINLASNVVRGDPTPFIVINAGLNLAQVCLAAVIARRVCGAAMDLRRPRRLAYFALLAVAPAVLASAVIAVTLATVLMNLSLAAYLFSLQRYFVMETLGLLIVTPTLLLMAHALRFGAVSRAASAEKLALLVLLSAVSTLVFFQNDSQGLFLIFPPLLLIVFRLSPPWAALAVILVAVIGGVATVTGHGPVTARPVTPLPGLDDLPTILRQLTVYYLFLLCVVVTALPISTVMTERRRLIARLRDRSEAAQVARRRAEAADAAKSRFLALMSHEMRTPLHSVVGYAEVVSRRPSLDDDARRQLGLIQCSGDALLMLVEDVLEIAGGDESVTAQALSLSELLNAAVEPSRSDAAIKDLSLTVEVGEAAVAPVVGDRRRLRQAVHHLVANAVKFTERGTIRISADRIGDDIVIAVADTGCGIDPTTAATLFDAFVQGDDSIGRVHVGAGIGLTLVRRHARFMGGEVALDSRPGQGSTFTLRLPLALAETAPVASPGSDDESRVVARVLVVDDHPANREVARLMLAPSGCEIFEAADGVEAVEMARAMVFDLILMDVRMPRMDGLAAARAIRGLPTPLNAVPILAVTADAMPEDAARCLAAGMNGHLAKPITHVSLYAAIDAVMDQAGVGAESVAA